MVTQTEFTAADIDAAIQEWRDNEDEDGDNYFEGWGELGSKYCPSIPGIGEFRSVTSWNLGDGHEQGVVVRHVESGRYFMKTGYYSSWDSGEYDEDCVEVTPQEVTVVRFVELNGKVHDDPVLDSLSCL